MEEAYSPLKKETAMVGSTINSTNTKYMIAGKERGRPSSISSEVVKLLCDQQATRNDFRPLDKQVKYVEVILDSKLS